MNRKHKIKCKIDRWREIKTDRQSGRQAVRERWERGWGEKIDIIF